MREQRAAGTNETAETDGIRNREANEVKYIAGNDRINFEYFSRIYLQ